MTKFQKLLQVFLKMLYISAFTFGGGFVIVSLMQKIFVEDLKWLKEDEMLDLAAIAQSCPGAIAVNASILVGYRMGGIIGAFVAVIGTIIPPLVILGVISIFYDQFRSNYYVSLMLKGMQAGVAAVIFDVVINLGGKVLRSRDIINIILMVIVFVATVVFKLNVILIILACVAFGVLRTVIESRRKAL